MADNTPDTQYQEPGGMHPTATQTELENDLGVKTSRTYALRSDQLQDGTYRYALEDEDTGEVIAEGVNEDSSAALLQFEEAIKNAHLTQAERDALFNNLDEYRRTA